MTSRDHFDRFEVSEEARVLVEEARAWVARHQEAIEVVMAGGLIPGNSAGARPSSHRAARTLNEGRG